MAPLLEMRCFAAADLMIPLGCQKVCGYRRTQQKNSASHGDFQTQASDLREANGQPGTLRTREAGSLLGQMHTSLAGRWVVTAGAAAASNTQPGAGWLLVR